MKTYTVFMKWTHIKSKCSFSKKLFNLFHYSRNTPIQYTTWRESIENKYVQLPIDRIGFQNLLIQVFLFVVLTSFVDVYWYLLLQQTWPNISKRKTLKQNVLLVTYAVLQDILKIFYLYGDNIFCMSLKWGCKCHVAIESAYGLPPGPREIQSEWALLTHYGIYGSQRKHDIVQMATCLRRLPFHGFHWQRTKKALKIYICVHNLGQKFRKRSLAYF